MKKVFKIIVFGACWSVAVIIGLAYLVMGLDEMTITKVTLKNLYSGLMAVVGLCNMLSAVIGVYYYSKCQRSKELPPATK